MAFEGLTEKLSSAFKKLRGKGRLSEADVKASMREIRLALLETDVNYKVVKDFIKKTTGRCVGTDVLESLTPAQMIVKIVNEELTALMGSENQKLKIASQPPTVVMLVGLQGAGKTTNGAKLAGLFKKQNKNPLLAACDIYRPAAIKQLQVVGAQLGIPVFEMGQTNPVDIAKAPVAPAVRHGHDTVFLYTARRTHVDEALLAVLPAHTAAIKPAEILPHAHPLTDHDAVSAAKNFDEYLDITGVMLSKLDGDARGGAALSIKAVTGKPIKFIGTGEKLDQIEPFHPGRMASRILGMGDMLTLIEKAQQTFDENQAQNFAPATLDEAPEEEGQVEAVMDAALRPKRSLWRKMVMGGLALFGASVVGQGVQWTMNAWQTQDWVALGGCAAGALIIGAGVGSVVTEWRRLWRWRQTRHLRSEGECCRCGMEEGVR